MNSRPKVVVDGLQHKHATYGQGFKNLARAVGKKGYRRFTESLQNLVRAVGKQHKK